MTAMTILESIREQCSPIELSRISQISFERSETSNRLRYISPRYSEDVKENIAINNASKMNFGSFTDWLNYIHDRFAFHAMEIIDGCVMVFVSIEDLADINERKVANWCFEKYSGWSY
jgi:hypothetical protein